MSESPVELKATLAALAGAAVVLLVGIDAWQHSNAAESAAATPSPAPAPAEAAPEPVTCGAPRVITVEDATPVRWELVRESDLVTTACPRITLYRDDEEVSNFELPFGVTFIDGDDGLYSYREGAEALPADQTVPNADLSKVWLIARTTDGRTVSATLEDGQLSFD